MSAELTCSAAARSASALATAAWAGSMRASQFLAFSSSSANIVRRRIELARYSLQLDKLERLPATLTCSAVSYSRCTRLSQLRPTSRSTPTDGDSQNQPLCVQRPTLAWLQLAVHLGRPQLLEPVHTAR